MKSLYSIFIAAADHYQTYWASRSMVAILEMPLQTRVRRLQLKVGIILAITVYVGFRFRNETGLLGVLPYVFFAIICFLYVWKRRKILNSANK
jgi:hypothetical protein